MSKSTLYCRNCGIDWFSFEAAVAKPGIEAHAQAVCRSCGHVTDLPLVDPLLRPVAIGMAYGAGPKAASRILEQAIHGNEQAFGRLFRGEPAPTQVGFKPGEIVVPLSPVEGLPIDASGLRGVAGVIFGNVFEYFKGYGTAYDGLKQAVLNGGRALIRAAATIERLEAVHGRQAERIREQAATIARLDGADKHRLTRIRELEAAFDKLSSDNHALQSSVKALTEENVRLNRGSCSVHIKLAADAKAAADSLLAENNELNARIRVLVNQKENLESRVSALMTIKDRLKDVVDRVQHTVRGL